MIELKTSSLLLWGNLLRLAWLVAMTTALPSCSKEAKFAGTSEDKADPVVVLDKEFAAGTFGHDELKENPSFGLVEQQITLAEKAPVTAKLLQVERPVSVDKFTQGYDGNGANEKFGLTIDGKLDLLIVIDNSLSMEQEQMDLATKLSSLTKDLTKVDWQIAVITTDDSCLQGGKVIKATDTDPNKKFQDIVGAIGHNGNPNEAGVKQALAALKGVCTKPNQDWLRDDSAVAVFFVSDEDSYCTNSNCGAGDGPNALINYMKGPKFNRPLEKLKAYALLWNKAEDSNCVRGPNDSEFFAYDTNAGSRYQQVVNAFNPDFGYKSICTRDYTGVLKKISENVSKIVKKDFSLQHLPVGSSITIKVDGKPFTEFTVEGKNIKMGTVPSDAVEMEVSYLYDPVPKLSRFKLTQEADAKTIEAFVGRDRVDPSKLTYDEATDELVFAEMPADNAVVKIKYRDKVALPTTFDLGKILMRGLPLEIQVGDKDSADYVYDDTTKVLSFPAPPGDGDEVKVKFKAVDSRITTYSAAIEKEDRLKSFIVKDADTGVEINATLEDGKVIFSEDDIVAGRKAVAEFDYGEAIDALKYTLGHLPLAKSLKVTHADGATDCIKDVKLKGKALSFDCDANAPSEVVISYDYLISIDSSFDIEQTFDASGHVQVFVDGSGVNFTMDGSVISIDPKLLTENSKVRVIVTQDQP